MPFTKGNNGGSKGRGKGNVSIVAAIKRKLEETAQGEGIEPGNKKTWLDILVKTYFQEITVNKKSELIKDVIDRVDGKPAQSLNLGNQKDENGDSEPFELVIVNSSRKD